MFQVGAVLLVCVGLVLASGDAGGAQKPLLVQARTGSKIKFQLGRPETMVSRLAGVGQARA